MGSLLLGAPNLSSLPVINHSIPINVVGIANSPPIHKWSYGVRDRNWLREYHWLTPEQDSGIFELHRIGVPADTLKRAGYEAKELLSGGYTESELLLAGYSKFDLSSK